MSMRRVLGDRQLRRLWLISLGACLGGEVSRIGLLLYVFQTRSSLRDLAIVVALETIPGSLMASAAGLVIDRAGPRAVMAASTAARIAIVVIVAARPRLSAVYAAAIAHSMLSALFQPAKMAAFPALAKPSDLPALNGLDQAGTNAMILLGPVLGAELLLRGGIAATLLTDAVCGAALLLLLRGIRIPRVAAASSLSVVGDLADGWRFVTGDPTVRPLLRQFFVALVCIGVWIPLAPFFLQERFGDSGRMLGWQLSILSGGAIAGAMIAPRLIRSWGHGRTMLAGLIAEGAAMTGYALVASVPLSLVVMGAWGVAASIVAVPFYAMVQAVVAPSLSGRVLAIIRQAENLALCLAMLITLALHQSLSASTIVLLAGLVYVASALWSAASRTGAPAFRPVVTT